MNFFSCLIRVIYDAVMTEGEKSRGGGAVEIIGNNLPFPVGIWLFDLPNIGGARGPLTPCPPPPPFRHHCDKNDFVIVALK